MAEKTEFADSFPQEKISAEDSILVEEEQMKDEYVHEEHQFTW